VYFIYAVINGVTTDTVQAADPNAFVTAVVDDSDSKSGYFRLSVN
jgi:hypothetical protein